jgi:hypothetical protein
MKGAPDTDISSAYNIQEALRINNKLLLNCHDCPLPILLASRIK